MTTQPTATRVLLIEDNSGDAELFRRALSNATVGRFEVDTVDRLSAAVARAAQGNIDVVVLDLSLPDSFGIETLETMCLAAPRTPIVVLTGDDDDRIGLEALNRGAQDYLVKGDIASRVLARALLFAIERRLCQDQLNHRDDLLAEAQKIAALGSFEWDLTTDAVACSEELRRIFGLDARFEPTYGRLMERVVVDDRARVHQVIQLAVSNRQTFDFEFRILRSGVVRTLHARGRAIVEGSGPPKRLAGTCQDVSERKKLEGELVLAGRMNSIGTLASGIAHEINNPLSYVMSNLEFIGQELRDVDDGALRGGTPGRIRGLADAVDQARQGAERVRLVVRGLEVFARADEERRGPIALQSVVELAVNLARNEIRHRARLIKEYRQDPYVEADEPRLSQVFVNLLVNAAQAIDEGKADENEIRVVVTTNAAGAAVVEVGDTGCGIPEANRGQIFDPFFTTKPVGTATGLGLSIAHGVVTAHGGEISFESSTSGRGVTFRVVLPAIRPVRPLPPPVRPAVGVAPGRRGHVLVVDDEPLIATVLRRILAADHEVTTARNGREAMERIDRGDRFDVILCDVMMPVMNGMAFHEQLSKAVPEQAEKIVFITGGAFTPAAKAFLDRVTNPRVEKPFESLNIRRIIRSLVKE
jgi:PAS domain S-box-containing protein